MNGHSTDGTIKASKVNASKYQIHTLFKNIFN